MSRVAFKSDVQAIHRPADDAYGFQRGRRFIHLPRALFAAVRRGGPAALGEEVFEVFVEAGFVARADASTSGNNRTDTFLDVVCDGDSDRVLKALQLRSFVVIGCGGLGSQIAVMLASLGAQRVTVVDRDTIEASNLNRLFWATPSHIGLAKVDVLSQYLDAHFRVKAKTLNTTDLAIQLGDETVRRQFTDAWVFLALDCADDERDLMRHLHPVQGIGYIRVGYSGAECVVGPAVLSGSDPCPFCASVPLEKMDTGVVFPSALPNNAATAGFAVSQALRLLQGRESSVHKQVWSLDLTTGAASRRRIRKSRKCSVCSSAARQRQ